MNTPVLSRRDFLKSATIASAALSMPAIMKAQPSGTAQPSNNNKLNIACVGVGGRGWDAVQGVKSENFVAFCDVDEERATKTYEEFPSVPRFRDYRHMLDKLGNKIDAVTISTPDHMYYPIAVAAMSLGKHVFLEKP